MKVGNLTFHFCHNYGGVLQCLALQQALQRLGVNAEVIDYNPIWKMRWVQRWGGLVSERLAERVLSRLAERRFGAAHFQKFRAFRKQHFRLSEPCLSIRSLRKRANSYDALMVGSDQVWNGEWHWPVYFLNFATRYPGRKISYAACFGHDRQPADFLKKVPFWLASFAAISVRNNLSRDMVKRLCGREPQVVADPTLLVDLRECALPPPNPLPQFILVYSLKTKNAEESAAIVSQVKSRLHLPVVSVTPGSLPGAPFPGADVVIDDAGPAEWVWLLANASYVCTDSFHGTIFSLKYRKPFVVLDHRAEGSKRLYDFADRFGFRDRLVAGAAQITGEEFWQRTLDFDLVHQRLESHIQDSYRFLKSALGMGPGNETGV